MSMTEMPAPAAPEVSAPEAVEAPPMPEAAPPAPEMAPAAEAPPAMEAPLGDNLGETGSLDAAEAPLAGGTEAQPESSSDMLVEDSLEPLDEAGAADGAQETPQAEDAGPGEDTLEPLGDDGESDSPEGDDGDEDDGEDSDEDGGDDGEDDGDSDEDDDIIETEYGPAIRSEDEQVQRLRSIEYSGDHGEEPLDPLNEDGVDDEEETLIRHEEDMPPRRLSAAGYPEFSFPGFKENGDFFESTRRQSDKDEAMTMRKEVADGKPLMRVVQYADQDGIQSQFWSREAPPDDVGAFYKDFGIQKTAPEPGEETDKPAEEPKKPEREKVTAFAITGEIQPGADFVTAHPSRSYEDPTENEEKLEVVTAEEAVHITGARHLGGQAKLGDVFPPELKEQLKKK